MIGLEGSRAGSNAPGVNAGRAGAAGFGLAARLDLRPPFRRFAVFFFPEAFLPLREALRAGFLPLRPRAFFVDRARRAGFLLREAFFRREDALRREALRAGFLRREALRLALFFATVAPPVCR